METHASTPEPAEAERASRAEDAPARRSPVLAAGFGTAVAMWAIGYLGRLPGAEIGPVALLAVLIAALFAGGALAGRSAAIAGWRAGAGAGFLASVVNLLVLGGLLGEGPGGPGAALGWIGGSLAAGALVGAAGGALAGRGAAASRERGFDRAAAFSKVAAAATFLLVLAGGLVTSHDAGLAVADWPHSYGRLMFLYPLSRMVGGIYYEHAHRLLGSLVGLTTIVLAIELHRWDARRWVRRLGWIAVALVVAQGALGGLRVTGRLTLEAAGEPDLRLAVVHGVLGQVFFATMVALATFASRAWKSEALPPAASSRSGAGKAAPVLVGLLLAQLVCGAVLRHFDAALLLHVGLAAAILPAALLAGLRAASAGVERPGLAVAGRLLVGLVSAQVGLGIGAWVLTRVLERGAAPGPLEVVVATAHQTAGALLLACAVSVLLWGHRTAVAAASARLAG